MAKIKKVFQPILDLLNANLDLKVEDIIQDVTAITQAKVGAGGGKASTYHTNDEGQVIAIRCYYFKKWMDPRVVPFGLKANSGTGLNSMCKEGTAHWTKQQTKAKKDEAALLDRVQSGELAIENLKAERDQIQEDVKHIADTTLPMYDTLEECLNA